MCACASLQAGPRARARARNALHLHVSAVVVTFAYLRLRACAQRTRHVCIRPRVHACDAYHSNVIRTCVHARSASHTPLYPHMRSVNTTRLHPSSRACARSMPFLGDPHVRACAQCFYRSCSLPARVRAVNRARLDAYARACARCESTRVISTRVHARNARPTPSMPIACGAVQANASTYMKRARVCLPAY